LGWAGREKRGNEEGLKLFFQTLFQLSQTFEIEIFFKL
jgi:hypothetical protein